MCSWKHLLTGAVEGAMGVKFSEDVVPISDLKINPGKVVRRVSEKHRPLLLTARGRGVAVVQSLADFEIRQEEQAFMKAVVQGMMDLESGRELSLADVRKRLGLS